VWTWGRNSQGQLGNGTTTGRSSPETTAGGTTVWRQVISAGRCSTASV
jgi:alpha-tubulin suppressor-like RCC1 family protein